MKNGFRADIEGLRAVAVGAVVLCHAGVPFLTGGFIGVDVFFVISGFLITGMLLREVERDGTLSLGNFYARRIRRLLPLSILVLVVVAIASLAWFGSVRNEQVSSDIFFSAIYMVNWHFAAQSVDYFAQGMDVSPVQHYWTLAVEEQFYLVWPAVMLLGTWWWRRRGLPVRPVVATLVAVIIVSSLAYSIYYSEVARSPAYFSTLTRAWELGIGAALVFISARRLPAWSSHGLAIVGLAAIIAASVLYTDDTLFPSYTALLPVLGTAALILAGSGTVRPVTSRLLEMAPVRYIGRVSYSWYLWHWPPLIFGAFLFGPLSVGEGLALVALSFIPTVISHHLVERPIHHSDRFKRMRAPTIALWAAGTGAAALAAVALLVLPTTIREASAGDVLGATSLEFQTEPQSDAPALRPTPDKAAEDRGPWRPCHANSDEPGLIGCVFGPEDAGTSVVAFGDSHMAQWARALNTVIREEDWRLELITKAACPPGDVRRSSAEAGSQEIVESCYKWREKALERIEELQPDIVLVGTSSSYQTLTQDGALAGLGEANQQINEDGLVRNLERIAAAADNTVVVVDIPAPSRVPLNVVDCVANNPNDFDDCGFEIEDPDIAVNHLEARWDVPAAERVEGVKLLDLTDTVCPDGYCRAVIGDVLVYRDDSHLTRTYVETLTPLFHRRLMDLVGNQRSGAD